VYLSQVPFPKKGPYFSYRDIGQRPILRSESVNSAFDHPFNSEHKKSPALKKNTYTPPRLNTANISPKTNNYESIYHDASPRHRTNNITPRTQNASATPTRNNKHDETPIAAKKLVYSKSSSEQDSSCQSNNGSNIKQSDSLTQDISEEKKSPLRKPVRRRKITRDTMNLVECWSKLESISTLSND